MKCPLCKTILVTSSIDESSWCPLLDKGVTHYVIQNKDCYSYYESCLIGPYMIRNFIENGLECSEIDTFNSSELSIKLKCFIDIKHLNLEKINTIILFS